MCYLVRERAADLRKTSLYNHIELSLQIAHASVRGYLSKRIRNTMSRFRAFLICLLLRLGKSQNRRRLSVFSWYRCIFIVFIFCCRGSSVTGSIF